MKNILIGFLSGIVIVGGFVWYFSLHPFSQTSNVLNKVTPTSIVSIAPTEELIGGAKDDHGCLIAAGYQWCEVKQKCLRSFEEACSQSETDDILDIAKALAKKNNWERYDNLKISISKNDGTYASGGVHEIGSEVGGGMWFAKKVNGLWEIVTDGNGVTLCSSLIAYPDYPSSLLPECFDDKKGIVIKR